MNNPATLVDPFGLAPGDLNMCSTSAGMVVCASDWITVSGVGGIIDPVWAPIPLGSLIGDVGTGSSIGAGGGNGAPAKARCTTGPLNLNQNIKIAKNLADQFWAGLLHAGSAAGAAQAAASANIYVGYVQTGGPWDPKTTLGETPENVAAGNINFGATCSQFGLNTWLGGQICQFGAGIYGKLTGNYGSPLWSHFHGDWPSDNLQVRQGLSIATKGAC